MAEEKESRAMREYRELVAKTKEWKAREDIIEASLDEKPLEIAFSIPVSHMDMDEARRTLEFVASILRSHALSFSAVITSERV